MENDLSLPKSLAALESLKLIVRASGVLRLEFGQSSIGQLHIDPCKIQTLPSDPSKNEPENIPQRTVMDYEANIAVENLSYPGTHRARQYRINQETTRSRVQRLLTSLLQVSYPFSSDITNTRSLSIFA
jgi:hypothetical protein